MASTVAAWVTLCERQRQVWRISVKGGKVWVHKGGGVMHAYLLRPSTAVLMFFRIWMSEWLFLQGGGGEG